MVQPQELINAKKDLRNAEKEANIKASKKLDIKYNEIAQTRDKNDSLDAVLGRDDMNQVLVKLQKFNRESYMSPAETDAQIKERQNQTRSHKEEYPKLPVKKSIRSL